VKIKQAGFVQVYDTEETFRDWLRKLVERKDPAAGERLNG
jgi:hypothetical protein